MSGSPPGKSRLAHPEDTFPSHTWLASWPCHAQTHPRSYEESHQHHLVSSTTRRSFLSTTPFIRGDFPYHVVPKLPAGPTQAPRVSLDGYLCLTSLILSFILAVPQCRSTLHSIPGPIEFSDPVLLANATPGTSHVSPAFVPIFGDCLRMLKTVLYAEQGEGNQAFLIAGSGTMGWDAVGVNLIEKGDDVVGICCE